MGGTDRQDQNLNKYRIFLRGKKWNWDQCFHPECLDSAHKDRPKVRPS